MRPNRRNRPPDPRVVAETLRREIERAREGRIAEREWDTLYVRAADYNRAVDRTNAMCGSDLRHRPPFEWECCAPHDSDPLWPALLERATDEQSHTDAPHDLVAIEDRAVQILREIAAGDRREARNG